MSGWMLIEDYHELDEYLQSKEWIHDLETVGRPMPAGWNQEAFEDDGHPQHNEMMDMHSEYGIYDFVIHYKHAKNPSVFSIDTEAHTLNVKSGQLEGEIKTYIDAYLLNLSS
jgi:hypothetical protein